MVLLSGRAGSLAPAFAQEPAPHKTTILDGVFTGAQAERGKEAYGLHCSSCHYGDLRGTNGPALKGQPFIDNWREDSSRSLFTFMRESMPRNAPASLSDQTYLDILAYILSVNMYPAGSNELRTDLLDSILIDQRPRRQDDFAFQRIEDTVAASLIARAVGAATIAGNLVVVVAGFLRFQ